MHPTPFAFVKGNAMALHSSERALNYKTKAKA
jgi:hypothetical protein